jgi:hypothetical protein
MPVHCRGQIPPVKDRQLRFQFPLNQDRSLAAYTPREPSFPCHATYLLGEEIPYVASSFRILSSPRGRLDSLTSPRSKLGKGKQHLALIHRQFDTALHGLKLLLVWDCTPPTEAPGQLFLQYQPRSDRSVALLRIASKIAAAGFPASLEAAGPRPCVGPRALLIRDWQSDARRRRMSRGR